MKQEHEDGCAIAQQHCEHVTAFIKNVAMLKASPFAQDEIRGDRDVAPIGMVQLEASAEVNAILLDYLGDIQQRLQA